MGGHRRPVDLRERLRACQDVMHALAYLHAERILHRDIKSSNCLLADSFDPMGNLPPVKLADFNLARKHDELKYTKGIGTSFYMAPEVISGEEYGPPADIYAMAVLIWEFV